MFNTIKLPKAWVLVMLLTGALFSMNTIHAQEASPEFIVYKDPQCGCCGKWTAHMEKYGFDMTRKNTNNLALVKSRYGINPRYGSCHTAVEQHSGYVFEGHIPAQVIQRFLDESPEDAIGLSVPGMPLGSPGMEMGDRHQPYEVLKLHKDGTTSRYAFVE